MRGAVRADLMPRRVDLFDVLGYFSVQNCTIKKVARTFSASKAFKMASVCSVPQAQSKVIAIFLSSLSTLYTGSFRTVPPVKTAYAPVNCNKSVSATSRAASTIAVPARRAEITPNFILSSSFYQVFFQKFSHSVSNKNCF